MKIFEKFEKCRSNFHFSIFINRLMYDLVYDLKNYSIVSNRFRVYDRVYDGKNSSGTIKKYFPKNPSDSDNTG